jgi:hypothetical protein
MGLYIDNYSRDVASVANTIVGSTFTGLLYQRSSGVIMDNTLYNNATGIYYAGQVNLADPVTQISSMTGNVLYGLTDNAWTLSLDGGTLLASDGNFFFHPYGPATSEPISSFSRPRDFFAGLQSAAAFAITGEWRGSPGGVAAASGCREWIGSTDPRDLAPAPDRGPWLRRQAPQAHRSLPVRRGSLVRDNRWPPDTPERLQSCGDRLPRPAPGGDVAPNVGPPPNGPWPPSG